MPRLYAVGSTLASQLTCTRLRLLRYSVSSGFTHYLLNSVIDALTQRRNGGTEGADRAGGGARARGRAGYSLYLEMFTVSHKFHTLSTPHHHLISYDFELTGATDRDRSVDKEPRTGGRPARPPTGR